jgi:hypothetical protein
LSRAAAGCAAAIAVALAGCGGAQAGPPRPRALAAPPPRSGPATIPGHGSLSGYLLHPTLLRAAPGGRVIVHLGLKTAFRSPRIFAVVARRRGWAGVLSEYAGNGRLAWLPEARMQLFRTPYSLEASLSRRLLTVRKGPRVLQRIPVAVGRPSNPTPMGRYAVTDKLLIIEHGGVYGCCALALTGRQPNVPQGWGGGDRLAIHSTNQPDSIGTAASLGCLRVLNSTMKKLVREIPLGTRVRITA